MTDVICTCGAEASDYSEPNASFDGCPCEPVFKIAAVLRHVEGLSQTAGAVIPAISEGAVAAICDVIANYRER